MGCCIVRQVATTNIENRCDFYAGQGRMDEQIHVVPPPKTAPQTRVVSVYGDTELKMICTNRVTESMDLQARKIAIRRVRLKLVLLKLTIREDKSQILARCSVLV